MMKITTGKRITAFLSLFSRISDGKVQITDLMQGKGLSLPFKIFSPHNILLLNPKLSQSSSSPIHFSPISKVLLLPPHFHFLSLPPNVTSLGHGELEHDAEEDTKGDDAQDDPDHHKVSRAASEALAFLGRGRRSFVARRTLPHGKLAILSEHHPMVVRHGGTVVLVVGLSKGGHTRMQ